jgi:hypothetical protein
MQENLGLRSPSVTAVDFLEERLIHSPEVRRETTVHKGGAYQQMASLAVATHPAVNESTSKLNDLVGRDVSALERKRLEIELGPGDDHDVPYRFVLPASMPRVLAWMRLLGWIQREELSS